ncbi:plasma membrane ascorbate-dependent reductase CYBRD1 [Spea bombifrons]|uniref:plasma membrane ascorbate-dependent reductase CYBRD1 n=1 Tax=Spea bombifrons TaxID=233779 RepID=UPI00234B0436|nr:plasma membrane ascorbate-dependent reductase CYBRD1 [Spea bombifrons]
MEGYKSFLVFLVSSLLLGFLGVIFVLVWVLHWREGLGWDGGFAEFNWHPVLVITGFIFIEGIAIIVYRLPWTWKCSKLLMKSIHAGLHLIAMVLMIVSLVAVFDYHNARNIPNMYSLHSWVGLTVVILFALQLVLSFLVYLLPFASPSLRAALMPVHVYSGILLYGSIIATALMGFTEKLIFALKSPAYSTLPPEGIFVNTLGLLIIVFGALVIWMVTQPAWKRPQDQSGNTPHPNRCTSDGSDGGSMATDCNITDNKSDVEQNSESARKRNLKLDEADQRSTM